MIELHLNDRNSLLKFNELLPVYNWYYPFPDPENFMEDSESAIHQVTSEGVKRRALYFHIPFCDTICTFCPFYRASYQNNHERKAKYVEAMIKEIEWKASVEGIGTHPVDVIFVGGGTPSILSKDEILKLGEAIHKHFDLSQIKEFTFEVEVKSVTPEKLDAMKEIGVNRISFGVQTFNPTYRSIFNITSTVEQVKQVAKWATERFDYVNCDILYGMAGQSLDDVLEDIDQISSLGTTTIDVYPLNNMTASLAMHKGMEKRGFKQLSPATKTSYRMFIDEYLRAKGYVPISGYAYTRVEQKDQKRVLLDHSVKFQYHDIVYGYGDDEIVAFGTGGVSLTKNFSFYNPKNTEEYIDTLLETGKLRMNAFKLDPCPERGIAYFPYRGELDKSRVDWDAIPDETMKALQDAVAAGLVTEEEDVYKVTPSGWLFYVNLMYYFTPQHGKEMISNIIETKVDEGRERDDVDLLPVASA